MAVTAHWELLRATLELKKQNSQDWHFEQQLSVPMWCFAKMCFVALEVAFALICKNLPWSDRLRQVSFPRHAHLTSPMAFCSLIPQSHTTEVAPGGFLSTLKPSGGSNPVIAKVTAS